MIIKNLKQLSDNGRHVEYIDLVNNLFELNIAERKDTTDTVLMGESH